MTSSGGCFFPSQDEKHNTPLGIYIFKVNNRNTRTKCEICSKLIIKTPEQPVFQFYSRSNSDLPDKRKQLPKGAL